MKRTLILTLVALLALLPMIGAAALAEAAPYHDLISDITYIDDGAPYPATRN